MSDVAKWALLVAGAVIALGMILAVAGDPFTLVTQLGDLVSVFSSYAAPYLRFGRGLVNHFVIGPELITIVLGYILIKWFVKLSLKILAWIYHYVFK